MPLSRGGGAVPESHSRPLGKGYRDVSAFLATYFSDDTDEKASTPTLVTGLELLSREADFTKPLEALPHHPACLIQGYSAPGNAAAIRRFLGTLRRGNPRMTAIDLFDLPALYARLGIVLPEVDFRIADATRMPLDFGAGTFDLILQDFLLNCIPSSQSADLLTETARMLAPQGLALVHFSELLDAKAMPTCELEALPETYGVQWNDAAYQVADLASVGAGVWPPLLGGMVLTDRHGDPAIYVQPNSGHFEFFSPLNRTLALLAAAGLESVAEHHSMGTDSHGLLCRRHRYLLRHAPSALLPLSPAQQMMAAAWEAPDTPGRNLEQLVIEVPQLLELSRLRAAWDVITERFDALRIQVRSGASSHGIQIAPALRTPWHLTDWRELAPEEQARRWDDFLRGDRRNSFDMDAAPYQRWHLFQLSPGHCRLVWTFHHLLLDGRSQPIVLAEWVRLLQAPEGTANFSSPAPTYASYLQWHQDWLLSQRTAAGEFWKALLEGYVHGSAPPLEEGLPATVSTEGLTVRLACSRQETTRLKELALHTGTTLNTLVQAAWALVLAAHGRSEDILFGAVRACRHFPLAGADRMVGLFINTLPVRVRLSDHGTLRSLLQDLRAQSLAVRPFEHTPYAVLRASAPLTQHQPLYSSVLVFEEGTHADNLALACGHPDWRFQLLEDPGLPLTVAAQLGETLQLQIIPDGRTYGRATAQRLLRHLVTALRNLPGGIEDPPKSLSLMNPAEGDPSVYLGQPPVFPFLPTQHSAFQESGGRVREVGQGHGIIQSPPLPPAERLLHRWFERQAERSPGAIALVDGERTATYVRLEQRANQLGRLLQEMGVGREDRVGVCLERSADLLVTLLAVLKAGAAYLPLPPSLPPDRLAVMLAEAQPKLLIHNRLSSGALPDLAVPRLDLDACGSDLEARSAARLEQYVDPGDLAYAIFTSGSTGTPKLVGIEHRNLTNLLAFATEQLFTPADVRCVPFLDGIGFDSSLHQIFVPLALGGTLVALPDTTSFAEACQTHPFTWLGSTPSAMAALLDAHPLPESVRCVVLGAEVVPPRLLERLRAFPHLQHIFNVYGPTEATVYCTVACLFDTVDALPLGGNGRIIGRPIAHTRIYLVDEAGCPVPEGIAGELWVAGSGIGRGYLNDAVQTAARFGTDPFHPSGGRLYRTGDLARCRTDGQLEFLGRLDDQVKLRGLRIEPGEIEQALSLAPGVCQAAVVVRTDAHGQAELEAYVVSNLNGAGSLPAGPEPPPPTTSGTEGLDLGSLVAFMKKKLPSAMIPSAFIQVPRLPVTPSGKLDRKALHHGLGRVLAFETPFRPPHSWLEASLLQVWSSVLELPELGVDDDFFAAGGNSLVAARLMGQVERTLDRRFPIARLFGAPTVASMARIMEASTDWAPPFTSLVSMQALGTRPPLYFLHGWGGSVFPLMELARLLGPDQPVYGLNACIDSQGRPHHQSLEEMAAHYVMEIRKHQPKGPYYLSGYSLGGWVAFEVAQQLTAAGERVGMLGLIDTPPRLGTPRALVVRTLVRHGMSRLWQAVRASVAPTFQPRRIRPCRAPDRSAATSNPTPKPSIVRAKQHWRQARALLGHVLQAFRPPTSDAALAEAVEDVFADMTRAYIPRPYPGPMHLFAGDYLWMRLWPLWTLLVQGGVTPHRISGSHTMLLKDEHLPVLAQSVRQVLEQAQRGG